MTVHNRGDVYALNGIIAKDLASTSATFYVALFTSLPTDTNASTAEVSTSGTGYSRQSVTLSRNTVNNKIENNTSTVTFSFTGSVSNIRYAAICVSQVRGTNDLIWADDITTFSPVSGSSMTLGNDAITFRLI